MTDQDFTINFLATALVDVRGQLTKALLADLDIGGHTSFFFLNYRPGGVAAPKKLPRFSPEAFFQKLFERSAYVMRVDSRANFAYAAAWAV
jgi:hypothetical protein